MTSPVIYHVFGSGDAGTAEIKSAMRRKGLTVSFHDIRKGGVSGQLEDLRVLQTHGLRTVPQVFKGSEYVGDFQATMALLVTLPDPERGLAVG